MNLPEGFELTGEVKPPKGFELVDESWGVSDTLRAAGAVLGGFAAMPVAGLGGLSRLITTGSLDEASKTMEGISSVPLKMLTTERQKQAAEKVGGIISWPFVQAGKGWSEIGKLTDVPYAEPVLGTLGEATGIVAVGGAKGAVKGRIKRGKVMPPEGFKLVEAEKVEPPKGFEVIDPVKEPVSIPLEKPTETLPEARIERASKEIVPPEAIVSEKAPIIEPPKPMGVEDTGIKNAVTLAEREARGLSEVEVETKRTFGIAFEEGKRLVDSGERDPRLLAEEMVEKPRPLSPEESVMLIYDRMRLQNEHRAAMDSIETAMKEGKSLAETEARTKLLELEERININDEAARRTGYEQGLGLAARRMMIQQDYSLAAMVQRARVESGKPVSADLRAKLEVLSKQIEDANAKIRDYETKAETTKTAKVIFRIKNEVAKEQRQAKRVYKKEELAAEFDTLVGELNQTLSQLNIGVDPMAAVILGKMAKNRVQSGYITVEALVDSIYTAVKNAGGELSKREIMDAISGYGKYKLLSKEELAAQLRDLKGQMQQISKLEDLQNRQAPLKTGFERRTPSAEERRLIKLVEDAKREYGIQVTDPETQLKSSLQSLKTRMTNRMTDLEKKIASGDFTKKPKREISLDPEAIELRFQLDKVIRRYHEALLKDRMANRNVIQRVGAGIGEAINLSRAIKTSFDLSAVLRQGAFVAFGHPLRAAKSIPDMLRAAWSEKGQFAIEQEIINRPNFPLYEKSKLFLAEHGQKLSQMEEVYMSRWAEKIPIVGASQRAYTTFLNKLRADSFDVMAANLSKTGKPTPQEANAIGNFVNVATGRGNMGMKENSLVGLNTVFFAPRYVASRFQLLAGQPLYRGSMRTRMAVAGEYARFLTGLGVVYTLGMSAGGNVGIDPRSADFGKVRFGKTRIDPMAGLSQTTVLIGRLLSGETKTVSGKIVPIRGPRVPYGSGNAADVMARFLRSKLSPVVGTAVDIAAGKDVVGQKVTPGTLPEKLFMPLAINDIYETMQEQGVPATSAMAILAIFGMGLQTYNTKRRQ